MKRCPQCNRVETDDALVFCRVDGARLVSESASLPSEPSTARLSSSSPASDEIETSILPHTTDAAIGRRTGPTTALPVQAAPATSGKLATPLSKRKLLIVSALVIVVAVGLGGYFLFLRKTTTAIDSIAVLPFQNSSNDPNVEYLSDGMTETLINSLSQLPNLNVKARSSVFRYKGKEFEPKKIASELNVQAILNGRVLQRGDDLILYLELVDAQTENVIWSESYNRKQADLVSLQSEIARDVSQKLKTKLSGANEAKVTKNYTANSEAYQLYLKGRFQWNKRTAESLRQAVEFYNQAIEKDPNYVLAYSGLAETYVLFTVYSVALAKDSMPQAKAAAMRALELDDSLAEAHTALGLYLDNMEWDRTAAEKEYRRAIELNPNYATAYHWLGEHLAQRKRFDESLTALTRAEELDPLSPIIGLNFGWTLYYARRHDEAIARFNRILSLDQNFAYSHVALGQVFYVKRMYPEAIAAYRKANDLSYDPVTKALMALAVAKSGGRGEATKLLNELKQESAGRYVPSYAIALVYTGLDKKEDALAWLEKEFAERGAWCSFYAVDPLLDDLRDDPHFKEMLKRLNLPE